MTDPALKAVTVYMKPKLFDTVRRIADERSRQEQRRVSLSEVVLKSLVQTYYATDESQHLGE